MKYCLTLLFLILGISTWSQTRLADQLKTRLPAGTTFTILFGADTGDAFQASGKDGVSNSVKPSGPDVPFSTGRRIQVPRAMTPVWSAQATSPVLHNNIPKGHVLLVSFWTRAPDMAGGRTGILNAYFEKAGPNWDSIATASASPDSPWRQIFLASILPSAMPAEGMHLSVHLGQQEQIIELGGLIIVDLGTTVALSDLPQNQISWPGQEADAPWRAAAIQKIEDLRRGDLTISVVDAKGQPIPRAEIKIEQVRRDFSFGSFTGHGDALLAQTEEGQRYRDFYHRLFDRATVPVYWADWGWVNHKVRYAEIARWARDQGLAIRGHVLVYPGRQFMPASTKNLSAEDLQNAFLKQIREVGDTLKDVPFREVDVTNELRDLTEIPNLVGRAGVAAWFKQARISFPGVKLALNENTILTNGGNTQANQDIFLEWYHYLKSQGVAPDVLGFQGHFGESLTGAETIWKILDRFAAETDAEFQITEFDINTNNEAAKAAYTRDFLTACFAHPRVKAVTLWGFWEGDHWIPQAASWNRDWSPRPAGRVLEELLGTTWQTHESWVTGQDGSISGRVWLGTLAVTVTSGKKSITQNIELSDPKKPTTITLSVASQELPGTFSLDWNIGESSMDAQHNDYSWQFDGKTLTYNESHSGRVNQLPDIGPKRNFPLIITLNFQQIEALKPLLAAVKGNPSVSLLPKNYRGTYTSYSLKTGTPEKTTVFEASQNDANKMTIERTAGAKVLAAFEALRTYLSTLSL